jgi:4-hydroxy-tetrahydrodipicolinate synthase
MSRTRELLDGDFNILSGDDPNTYKMMSDPNIGASGVVSVLSNLLPAAVTEQVKLTLLCSAALARPCLQSLSHKFIY